MTAVHQFVPSFAPRDAIGNHTLKIQRVLNAMGIDSEIYVWEARPELRRLARHYRELGAPTRRLRWFGPAREGAAPPDPQRTWLLYQSSTGSPLAEFVMGRPERQLVDYHNITPDLFFTPWEPHVAAELALGRRQLAQLAVRTELALADSAYNEAELVAVGFRATAVLPILLDPADFASDPDPAALRRLQAEKDAGGSTWLFVGRVSPNKAQHEIVKAFVLHRRHVDPRARLHLVGGSSSHAYLTALEAFVADLDLGEGAVTITGSVAPGVLAAHYATADVFVSCSEHEGFGVPLLEAMYHGVPVVAVDAAAVGETLGGAGLLLAPGSPALVAAAAERVVRDASVREVCIARGRARVADFALDRTEPVLRRLVDELVRS